MFLSCARLPPNRDKIAPAVARQPTILTMPKATSQPAVDECCDDTQATKIDISANNRPHSTASQTRCERAAKPLNCPHSHAASIQTTSVIMANPTGGNKKSAAMTAGINTKAEIRRYFSKSNPHQALSSPGSVPPKRRSRLAKACSAPSKSCSSKSGQRTSVK